jgi:hypothetical protein
VTRCQVRGIWMELPAQARQAHNRHFRRVSPTPAARNHLTTKSIFDPRPRSANKVRTLSQNRCPARTHRRRILRAIQLTYRSQQLLLPTHPSTLHRKYGSGQVGAYAGVGAHWYVHPKPIMMRHSYWLRQTITEGQLTNASVNRVSRPLLQPRPPRDHHFHLELQPMPKNTGAGRRKIGRTRMLWTRD